MAKLTTSQLHKVVFTIFVLTSQFLFSQTKKKDTLKEEAIKAVNIYKKNFKEIVPAQVLQGEELERLNSHSVADALRYFSGVQIKDYGGIGGLKTINIRSMGSQHVGVFMMAFNWEMLRTVLWIWGDILWMIWKKYHCTTVRKVRYFSPPGISDHQVLFICSLKHLFLPEHEKQILF